MAGKWEEDMIYRAYACAASGMNVTTIAKALGVDFNTLQAWRAKYPVIERAMESGWASAKAPAQLREEWVFARLEPHLRALWMDIEALWESETSRHQIFDRVRDVPDDERQAVFLYALASSTFSVNAAMQMVGIGKKTMDRWLDDPNFAELVSQVEWHKDNFIEDRFLGLVRAGYEPAIMWAARTKLAARGYGQSVKVSGEVAHTHAVGVNLYSLGLPSDLLDQVVSAMLSGTKVGPDGLLVDVIEGSVNREHEETDAGTGAG